MPHARQIAQLARLAHARGESLPAQEAQPLYLRNKVALTTSERMARAGAAA
jgi:tRNA threonylcarbamoyladenosine biosynthesis protein TsaB